MGRDFSALNKYGHREYKFAQSDSYRQVDNWSRIHSLDLSGGVCMGTTLNWVKEKLTTSNGLLRSEGPLLNPTSKRFSNPLNPVARLDKGISPPKDSLMNKFINKNESKSGPRNESTMAAGAMTQAAYEQNISRLGLTVGTRRVTEELGLVPGTHEQYPGMTKGEDS